MRRLNEKTVVRNVRNAIDQAGGRAGLARYFKTTHWSINKWYRRGRIPSDRIKEVCRLANKQGSKTWTPELLLRDAR